MFVILSRRTHLVIETIQSAHDHVPHILYILQPCEVDLGRSLNWGYPADPGISDLGICVHL